MDDRVKQNLINNTKEFLANHDLIVFGGLCGRLAHNDNQLVWNGSYNITTTFMQQYLMSDEPYISPYGQVTPERIKAAEHFLEWLESQ